MRSVPLVLVLALTACAAPPVSLVESDAETVELSGVSRAVLAPPFPATQRFEVDVPSAGFLTFSAALVTEQPVRRAQVAFRVEVELDGDAELVHDEVFDFRDANEWHGHEIDLTRWAGERVTLNFITQTPEARTNILWAERVRAVWGDPSVVSSPGRQLALSTDVLTAEAESWLVEQVEPSGFSADDLLALVMSLILAGVLGLVIRELYLRFAVMGSSRDAYGNLFPLFSITTMLVIIVVRSSLALSLGLIGALSIVRFRTAIKTPEEIAYLLFCISVGVALGAERQMMAITSVALIALLVIARHRFTREAVRRYLLTVSGDVGTFFDRDRGSAVERVRPLVRELEVQRLDHEGERIELRAVVTVDARDGAESLVSRLRRHLPALQFSFVEADDVI